MPAWRGGGGYAITGDFEDAVEAWGNDGRKADLRFHRSKDEVVAGVGTAAMTVTMIDESVPVAARRAMQLVNRTLFVWVTVLSVMTLYGWVV